MSRVASSKYSGHVGDGGLQGHSVSGAYPWIIVGYGDNTWAAVNACTGMEYPRREKIAEAQRDLGVAVEARETARRLEYLKSMPVPRSAIVARYIARNSLIGAA